MTKLTTKKIVVTAILSSLSLITFLIENLFPPLFIPGAKMGLSNIFVLLAILLTDFTCSLSVLLIKVILGSIFGGSLSSLMYSLPAGLTSFLFQYFMINLFYKKFSLISICVASAILHNIVQCVVYAFVTNAISLVYLPYLSTIGVVSGLIVGFSTFLLIKILPQRILYQI